MKTILIILACLFFIAFFKILSRIGKTGFDIRDGQVYYYQPVNGLPMFRSYTLIPGADAESFEIVETPYAKDRNHVYLNKNVISDCDPASFEVLSHAKRYSRDANAVFNYSTKISDDPNSFEVLAKGLAKDKYQVYRYEQLIESADPATFEVLGNGYFRDKDHMYIDIRYGLDGVKIIEGANPTTSIVDEEDPRQLRDGNSFYIDGKLQLARTAQLVRPQAPDSTEPTSTLTDKQRSAASTEDSIKLSIKEIFRSRDTEIKTRTYHMIGAKLQLIHSYYGRYRNEETEEAVLTADQVRQVRDLLGTQKEILNGTHTYQKLKAPNIGIPDIEAHLKVSKGESNSSLLVKGGQPSLLDKMPFVVVDSLERILCRNTNLKPFPY